MFFLRKDQVDRDVEKMRESLMTPEQIQKKEEREQKKKEKEKKHADEQLEDFGWKDVVAMTIAILEIIGPYFLLFIGFLVVLWQVFYHLWS